MTRKSYMIIALAMLIGMAPAYVFAAPSGLGNIHSSASFYHNSGWTSSSDLSKGWYPNFGTERIVYNSQTGQWETHYGLASPGMIRVYPSAVAGSSSAMGEVQSGPVGTGAVESYDGAQSWDVSAPSMSAAESPYTVEAYMVPSDISDSMGWYGNEAIGTGALPSSSVAAAFPTLEDIDTGDAPFDDHDTFFNPFHPDLRLIDMGGGGGD
jgi:hypothetical protein